MQSWVLPIFLGLGLAAATGFRTFLPLLILAVAAHFHWLGRDLNVSFAWLGSDTALIALGAATVIELAADKVPVLDHALTALGTVTRPIAGAIAAGAVFAHADPAVAVIAGLIIGVPTALAVHSLQGSTRIVSTATTAGLANPVISVLEDIASGLIAVLALALPILAPIAVALLLFLAWRVARALRRSNPRAAASSGP